MPENRNKIEEYVAEVCEQIRWKRAKEGLAMELRTHLLDQQDACLAEGMTEEEARAECVRQMGDPVEVGTQLDRVHRPRSQWDLMILVWGLVLVGLVIQGTVMMQLPSNVMYEVDTVERSMLWAVLGGILMLAIYWLDYTVLERRAPWFCVLGAAVTALSFLDSPQFNYRYLTPYYFLMLAPVCIALLIYGMRGKGWRGLLFCWGGMGVFVMEAFLVPSFTMVLIIMGAGTVLLLAAVWKGWMGVSKRLAAAALLVPPVALIAFLLSHSAYLVARLELFFHPERDPLGKGYTGTVARELLQKAQWLGQGGASEWRLPNVHSDYFLTWVIHRLGWAVGLALVAALVLLLAVALRRCFRQKGMLGFLLSLAAVLTLGAETTIYVLNNLGFGPIGLVALPFLSYGGRYMVVNLALAGLLMSVFREERLPQAQKRETPRLRRKWITLREDGAVVILPPWVKKAAQ